MDPAVIGVRVARRSAPGRSDGRAERNDHGAAEKSECTSGRMTTEPRILCVSRQAEHRAEWYDCGMTTEDETTDKTKSEKDFVTRLADAGEEALQRIADLPGGQKALTAYNDLKTRVDELGKKVRGIDALEARVAKLEKEVTALKKAKPPARQHASR